jgi:type II secretory pathway component PulM
MTGAMVVLGLLAVATLVWIVGPILRPASTHSDEYAAGLGRARELQSRHQQLLASLRDLEDDRTTDKIDEADYEEMRNRLSAEAIEIMRAMDELKEERDTAVEAARKAAAPLRHPGAARTGPRS